MTYVNRELFTIYVLTLTTGRQQAACQRMHEADARNNNPNTPHTKSCIVSELTRSSRQGDTLVVRTVSSAYIPSFKYRLGCEHTFNPTSTKANTHYATRFVFHPFFHSIFPSQAIVCGRRHTRSLWESDDCDGCKYGYRQSHCKGGYIPSFNFCNPQRTMRFLGVVGT